MRTHLFDLTGKVALVTGSYQGLGLAIARGLGQAGATLVLNGRNLDVNLTGLFLVSRQVVQEMIARKAGKIINICSLMCEMGRPTVGAYTAAKGGVKMLTKAMALEWGKHNIQVNGIGPGYFATEMNRPLKEDSKFDACMWTVGSWRPCNLYLTAVQQPAACQESIEGNKAAIEAFPARIDWQ